MTMLLLYFLVATTTGMAKTIVATQPTMYPFASAQECEAFVKGLEGKNAKHFDIVGGDFVPITKGTLPNPDQHKAEAVAQCIPIVP